MVESEFVFESGEAVQVGSAGEHGYEFVSGEPLVDSGKSDLVFVSGTGIGGVGFSVTISDNSGEVSGNLPVIERAKTVEDFYGYQTGDPSSSAGGEAGTEYAQDGYLSFMVYRNTNSGATSLVVVYDEHDGSYPGTDGDAFDVSYDGFASAASIAVRDDDTDSYSFSPPTASTAHTWGGNNTDGWAVKDAFDGTLTVDLGTGLDASYNARGIGDDKSTVEREVIEGETTLEITP